jgi:hypothetical protein
VKIAIDSAAFARDLKAACTAEAERVAVAAGEEVKAGAQGLQADLRRETEAFLGAKIANAWRSRFYPNKGQTGGPAGFVWTKAPKIIDFFSSSKLVTPIGEAFAIPTDAVPRGARGRRLSPIEVEARFNAELVPVRLPSGRLGLAIDVIAGRNGRGFRAPTPGRRKQGRASKMVLMFVLLRGPLQGRRLIDLNAFAERWGNRIAGNIGTRLERGI